MKKIFLSVGYDGHIDDWYAAFDNLDDAVQWCKDEEESYPEYDFKVNDYDIPEWPYHSSAGDDLPKFHVEEIEYYNA